MSSLFLDTLHFSTTSRSFLDPHLPPEEPEDAEATSLPFVTLTFATSLDSQLSLFPGTPTILSGLQSKAMTHYLRSRHDGILIGVGTAEADNPGLNCRLEGVGGYGGDELEGQPRPVIIDPRGRWELKEDGSKILELVRDGRGRAPWVVVASDTEVADEKRKTLEKHGGKYIKLPLKGQKGEETFDWRDIFDQLSKEGLKSVMVEGGGGVINSLLVPEYFDVISSVIVTIAPTWLGRGGVVVSPDRREDGNGNPMAAVRLRDVNWHPFGEDVVMCGKLGSE
jgi:2,5-diamino-6-(ribosylamino)-4(3H)-pyrimidinone 5'-phosphate reductase